MYSSFTTPPLQGKIIAITGATGSLGSTLCEHCASHGAQVIMLGKNPYKLELLSSRIEQKGYPAPSIIPINFAGANPDDYHTVQSCIQQHYPQIDALVHIAAMLGPKTTIQQYPILQWYEVLQVNLNAQFLLTQTLLPLLKLAPVSKILFTGAPEAATGIAYTGAYAVTKAALANFSSILQDELSTNTKISVNIVTPPKFRGKIRQQSFPGESLSSLLPPQHFMASYLYLLSDCATMQAQCIQL